MDVNCKTSLPMALASSSAQEGVDMENPAPQSGSAKRLTINLLNGEPVKIDLAALTLVGEVRKRTAEASELWPSDVQLLVGDRALGDKVLLEELVGSTEDVVSITVVISNFADRELEKGLARRTSVKNFSDLQGSSSLNFAYFRGDGMQDVAAVMQNPELGKQFRRLPNSITEFENLESLDAGNHELTHLPVRIGNLSRLQRLRVDRNQLMKLPDSICSLVELQELHVQKNMIDKLPNDFGNLVKLKRLNVADNRLSDLPKSFVCMVELQELNLNNNHFARLPSDFSELSNLKTLHISGNKIERLPDGFEMMQLSRFSYEFRSVREELRASFVHHLPEKFKKDPELKMYLPAPPTRCPCRRRAKEAVSKPSETQVLPNHRWLSLSPITKASWDLLRGAMSEKIRNSSSEEPPGDPSKTSGTADAHQAGPSSSSGAADVDEGITEV